MIARVKAAVGRAALEVHARRLRRWAADADPDYPTLAEARKIAEHEVAVLCLALGGLVEIDPFQFAMDLRVLHPKS